MKKITALLLVPALVLGPVITKGEEGTAVQGVLSSIGQTLQDSGLDAYSILTKTDEDSETVTISKEEYDRLNRFSKLAEVYDEIMELYYVEPDQEMMLQGAIEGMVWGLGDVYTYYYTPEEWEQMWEDDSATYAGVGIQMLADFEEDTVKICRVFKESPAERAGIRRGDRMIRVEDMTVTAENMTEATELIRQSEGPVQIEVVRGEESQTFSLTPEVINANWVETTMLDDSVGLLIFYEFSSEADEMFRTGLKELEDQGAKSIIVDLRDNGGGWVDIAESIGDIFLDEELMYYSENRQGEREEHYTTDGKDEIPLVLLVNGASASASEILCGSLQEYDRAVVVGEQTYGKGIMQYVVNLSGVDGKEDGMQVTYAQYFMPSGKAVHMTGITPDIIVEMPEDLIGEIFELGDLKDPQLKRAWEEAVALTAEEDAAAPAEEAGGDASLPAAEEDAA